MKRISILFAVLCFVNHTYAQTQNISDELISIWDSMPDSLCSLKKEAKIDTTKSSNYCLFVNVSKKTNLQIASLKGLNGEIITCIIKTYSDQMAESNISFYDNSWNRVGTQEFNYSCFSSDTSFQKYFIPTLISASFKPDNTLAIILSDQNISEDNKKIIPFPLTKILKWSGKSFE